MIDDPDVVDPGEPTKSAPTWRKVLGIAVSVAVVVAVFGFVLPSIADYGEVIDTIKAMTWLEVTSLLLAALWNLASYQPPLMASLPGLTFKQAGARVAGVDCGRQHGAGRRGLRHRPDGRACTARSASARARSRCRSS